MSGAVIIGGGPAGLMAAEQLTQAGIAVDLYDAMPTVGRKFLLAGIGGLNITHSEAFTPFCARYGTEADTLRPMLQAFDNQAVRDWCAALGVTTFVGSSGRVFPEAMKAAPLLRAWLARLKQHGLRVWPRHRWLGWDEQGQLRLQSPEGEQRIPYRVLVLALGGASWKKLGSDGQWAELLAQQGVAIAPLQAANCGFLSPWSEHLRSQHAGAPLKSLAIQLHDVNGQVIHRKGELILTAQGLEGSLIYAVSRPLREQINHYGAAHCSLDLCPDYSLAQLTARLQRKAKAKSWGSFFKSSLKLDAAKTALFFEEPCDKQAIDTIATRLKALTITLTATTPIDEAISSAGGIRFSALNQQLMLHNKAGVFCAGEMLDWEAPTGGYLLNACLATGRLAGQGAVAYLSKGQSDA